MTNLAPFFTPLANLAVFSLALVAVALVTLAVSARSHNTDAAKPARTPLEYRAAIAAAEAYAEAAEPGTVRDAVWDRAYLQMLTAQGLAISTRQATGEAYPYGFALPAEYLGKFFGPEHTPWIVWAKDAA